MTGEQAWMRNGTTSRRRRREWVGATILGATFLGASLIAGSATAQSNHTHGSFNDLLQAEALAKRTAAAPAPPAPIADGLSGGGFYLEADEVVRQETEHHIQASGHVEARYRGRTLRADRVDYDTDSGQVVATGHVEIIADDGSAQFADKLSLDKAMNEGFATGFSTRLQEHVQIAAAGASRRNGDVTVLDHVIYTPCTVCQNGHPGLPPTWSIRARRVVEDKRRKTLVFHDAVIEIRGQPVFYLPVLAGSDPSAERKSGFLLPFVTYSGERGLSYQQPYYQVISRSQDITISPQINSKVNPFLNIDYRKRFYSGTLDVRAGATYDRDFTSGGVKFGPDTARSYILGSGVFRLDPSWIWGFTAERTSDKLLFDKYSIGDAFIDRGLYGADDRRLISQLYAVRQDSLSYLSVAAINVQGLRANDLQSTFPTVAPLIEARYEPKQAILGGRLRLDASAVVLTRSQILPPSIALDGGGAAATNDRRATAQADWQRTFTLRNGLRVVPFLDGRVDLYDVAGQNLTPSGATTTRGYGVIGATVSYPLVKVTPAATWIIEPIAQVAISPNYTRDPRIPNEDSIDFQFDETNLFQANRSPGFDLVEGGQSVTVGGRATLTLPDGRGGSFILGRRFAVSKDTSIPSRTGLRSADSDYVFYADATPFKDVWAFSRLRLASNGYRVNFLEVGVRAATSRLAGYASYVEEARSPSYLPVLGPTTLPGPPGARQVPGDARVKSLDLHGEAFVTRNWGVTGYAIVDSGVFRRQDIGVVYRDDCLRVEVLYRHDETFNGTLGPSTSVVLRLSLATFGTSGYVADPHPSF
jgi:LPS-assembly protein